MPMYGDPKSMVEKTPQQETNDLLKKQIEVLEEQLRVATQGNGEAKKTNDKLSRIESDNSFAVT